MLTLMQRQHLLAEVEASKAQRLFKYMPPRRSMGHFPNADAHVRAWRQHKIDTVLDSFIAKYSLELTAVAGRVG